jgi:soluble lytic murein transglycosylase
MIRKHLKVNRIRSIATTCLLAWLILVIRPWNSPAADQARRTTRPTRSPNRPTSPSALEQLATQAKQRSAELRRYAESTKSLEEKGRAYLVLGYTEFDSHQYSHAVSDLARAAATKFSLADFAAYYEGEAAQDGQLPAQVVEALQDYSVRYPQSALRRKAINLLGQALLKTNQPERVISLLANDSKISQHPALQVLLARALWQAQCREDAARAFQEIYYSSPTSPEADIADGALKNLQPQIGATFPRPTLVDRENRAELLFKAARWDAAFREYESLLSAEPSNALADNWKVRRARCLIYQRRAQQALDSLAPGDWSKSSADPDRLAALVLAYEQLGDQPKMFDSLAEVAGRYPRSPAYGEALWSAGNFFLRREDWKSAAQYYAPLHMGFPEDPHSRDAQWRVAWGHYLAGDKDQARQGLLDHLSEYPSSSHAAAALYWLGRLTEQEEVQASEARPLYSLLRTRFANSYYARQSDVRSRSISTVASRSLLPPDPAVLDVSGTHPALAIALAQQIAPRKPAPANLCVSRPGGLNNSNDVIRSFTVLRELSLNQLARDYLKAALAEPPQDPELLLTLSRFEREQGNVTAALFEAIKVVPNYSEYDFSDLPAEVWRLLYPLSYWSIVQREARLNHLDPYLVMGLIRQESGFNPKATSDANARGLMQMLPQTAAQGLSRRRRRVAGRRLYDPAYNIRVACRYLSRMIKSFNGNLEQSLAAYNAGDSRVREWLRARTFNDPAEFLESVPFRETRHYVEALLRDAAIYRQMLAGSAVYKRCG